VATEVVVARLGVPIDALVVLLPCFVLAIYSVGAHARPRPALAGLVIAVAGVTSSVFAHEGPGAQNRAVGLIMVPGRGAAGRRVRRQTDQAVDAARRAADLEHHQAERERDAMLRERARIARELHDIISHSVSVMTIQAGAVEEVVEHDPVAARVAAASIRTTGRAALADLRRLLDVLRDGEAGPAMEALSPQPSLADLHVLADRVRGAGLQVLLDLEELPDQVPQAIVLSVVRVVQEALTNVLRHADAGRAEVRVSVVGDAIEVEVLDDGRTGATRGTVGGHGLAGMRERVALYGGTLACGARPGGGFRVHARLPLVVEAELA
jgi:signal transduction histidine kinase